MENVSEFVRLADEAVADFREWRRLLELAIEAAQNGEADSLALHKVAAKLHAKSDESREAALAAAEGLPTILEAAGEDSRGLLAFLNMLRGLEGLADLRSIEAWEKLRPDLERFAVRQGTPAAAVGGETTPPAGVEQTKTPEVKRPSENAFRAWRLRDLMGISNQTELAEKMTENGVPANQGQVSRWLKQVEEYMAAGGVLPKLSKMDKPAAIDPSKIDLGKRQDGLTPHQRKRRDDS